MALVKMSYEDFLEKFKPVKNTIDTNASYDGLMFETFGKEYARVRRANDYKIFTIVEAEGNLFITSGWHFVNRIGYFVTKVAFDKEEEIEINLQD